MQILATRFLGHTLTASQTPEGWEVEIDLDTPVMDRRLPLRSTYLGPNVSVALHAAYWDIVNDIYLEDI